MVRGVPKGYKEFWKYRGRWKERKLGKGFWGFTFKATKGRNSRSYGNYPRGSRFGWYIKARQYVIKTGKGRYQTIMKGTKRLIHSKVKRRRY